MESKAKENRLISPKYGRLLSDFRVGDIYHHPWEVTIDDGMLALFAASFLDPNPLYSSRRFASEMGFRDRVAHPMALLNLALSFSVHDISEQTIAHLGYTKLVFPNAAFTGDTLRAFSEVLDVRPSESKPDCGIVHVRITGMNQDDAPVISFERRALIPEGNLKERAHPDAGNREALPPGTPDAARARAIAPGLPREIAGRIKIPAWPGRPSGLFEDFETGDIILHDAGRTVGESEHMQLAQLSRNSHPLHVDEVYSRDHSFAGTRVVCGGLVFAWATALASRDTSANALWEIGYDNGRHSAPVLAGDTLYAASRVTGKRDHNEQAGIVEFHLVCVKNVTPRALLGAGVDLFEGKLKEKAFEIHRAILLPRLP